MRSLLLLASILVALVAAGCGSETEESVPPPDRAGRAAPAVEGVTIDGERLSLADFRGQPVFVNVWASW